jgi:hypothetical protein
MTPRKFAVDLKRRPEGHYCNVLENIKLSVTYKEAGFIKVTVDEYVTAISVLLKLTA